jgi:hypothetical protein
MRNWIVAGMFAAWPAVFGMLSDMPTMAAEPIALRVENLTVPPSSGPLIGVQVKNLSEAPLTGTVSLTPPEGWQLSPAKRQIALKPGELGRVPFSIAKATNVAANAYPFTATATANGAIVEREQTVFAATAPYFKPTIDGDPSEWNHAVPVQWETEGRKTTVRTYWSRRQFAVLVEVDEAKVVPFLETNGSSGFDAVQIAIAPQGAVTGSSPEDETTRFEFLVAAGESGEGRCFQLAAPGMKLALAAKPRALVPLAYDDAEVAVRRQGDTTIYECSFSFRDMRDHLKPSEGREFCFSVLVHDPDGTGLRDLGTAANLWPWQRNPLGWSRFQGDARPETPPWDSKLKWGMCSSVY